MLRVSGDPKDYATVNAGINAMVACKKEKYIGLRGKVDHQDYKGSTTTYTWADGSHADVRREKGLYGDFTVKYFGKGETVPSFTIEAVASTLLNKQVEMDDGKVNVKPKGQEKIKNLDENGLVANIRSLIGC